MFSILGSSRALSVDTRTFVPPMVWYTQENGQERKGFKKSQVRRLTCFRAYDKAVDIDASKNRDNESI